MQRRRLGTSVRADGELTPVVWLLGTVLTLAAVAATAQGPATLEFAFSNPGARAMGFGGAFAALADDATAAFANPAGLVQLLRPEVSVEGRRWSYSTPYNQGGRIRGEPTGIGIDTDPGIHTATSRSQSTDLSFASFVYPRGAWAVAVFTHKLANYSSVAETQGIFGEGSDVVGTTRFLDARTRFDLDVDGLGIAAGWRLGERLSVGAGLIRYAAEIESVAGEFLIDEATGDAYFGINHYLPSNELSRSVIAGDGHDWVVNGGFLWTATPRLTVGGFFRQGPELPLVGTVATGPASTTYPAGTVLGQAEDRLALPDVFGLGLGYRSADGRLTVSAEWDRVRYSMITDSLASPEGLSIDQVLDDGDELRLGGEYVFLAARPVVAVRVGTWRDPDHRLRSISDDPLDHFYFEGGSDEMHYALGLGVAFENFQLDVGIDVSDLVDTASLSIIYSF